MIYVKKEKKNVKRSSRSFKRPSQELLTIVFRKII